MIVEGVIIQFLTGQVMIQNVERRKSECCWLGGATADGLAQHSTAEGEAAAAAVPLC